ncbi:glycosyltransferase family 2 protein [Pyxidicoccus sp. 3LFB2]
MKPGVTVVMVAYDNEERALTRLMRDLMPSLLLYRGALDAELRVVDNSARPQQRLAEAVRDNGVVPGRYLWNEGRNLFYGPALNLAVQASTHPFLLYVCANHGRMLDPTWLWDLLAPLVNDTTGKVALTGSHYDSGPPSKLGFPNSLPAIHIQGGLFAARTAVLAKHPYPDGEYAHWSSDIYQSFQLMQQGYQLVDVPTVKSVWRSRVTRGHYKFIHDDD